MAKTLTPTGTVHVHFCGFHVRLPFAGVEPTSTEVIDLALEQLRNAGMKPRAPRGWALEPVGSEEDLHFKLVEA